MSSAEEKDPVKRSVLEFKLFCYKYGYVGVKEPFSKHILYNKNTRDFYHPFSAKAIGESFGYREYSKLIPLKDYLTTSVDVIEDILEGVARGESELAVLKKQAADKAARALAGKPDQVINNALAQGMKNVK